MSISGYNTNRFRLTGLNSGLDTAAIVANLMNVERMSVNKIQRNKILSEWRLENYNKINSDLMSFSNKYLSALSKDNIMSAGAYMDYGANYQENSYFKVTGSAGIIPGNYKITETELASYAQLIGDKNISQNTQINGKLTGHLSTTTSSNVLKDKNGTMTENSKLADLVNADGTKAFTFDEDGKAVININNRNIEVSSTDDVKALMSEINSQSVATNVEATLSNGQLQLKSEKSPIVVKNLSGSIFNATFGIKQGTTFPNDPKFGLGDTLADIKTKSGIDFMGGQTQLKFKINDKEFTFTDQDSLQDIMDTVNSSGSVANGGAGARMTFDIMSGQVSVRSTEDNKPLKVENVSGNMFGSGSAIGVVNQTATKNTNISTNDTMYQLSVKMGMDLQTDADGNFAFKINGKEFKFSKYTSLSKVMNDINTSDAGVRMSYSQLTDSFTFTASKIGGDGKVDLANAGSNVFGPGGIFGTAVGNEVGKNASITINGDKIERSSNSFTIDGMNFEITGNLTTTANPDGYNISFSQNIDSTVGKVKAFIEDYNKIIKDLSGLLSEKKKYKFDPLLPEEEEDMTEKEIEKWTKEAKSGILRNDPVLSSLMTNLRSAAYAIVGDTGMMAAGIGITTKGTNGELQLDETVFKNALTENPTKVAQIMTRTSSATEADDKYKESGFAVRLFNTMSQYRSNTRANQIQDETKKINDFDEKILAMEKKLVIKEERYWQKYAQLEKLMGNMNSQSDWLTTQLGALQ